MALCFPFFVFNTKICLSPKKGHFYLFVCVPLCLSLALFWPPPFHFIFLCLSLVIFSSFLLVSHVSFWVLLLVFVLFAFSCKMFFCFFLLVVLFCLESLYLIYFWFCTVFSYYCCCCCCCFVWCFALVFSYKYGNSKNVENGLEIPKM